MSCSKKEKTKCKPAPNSMVLDENLIAEHHSGKGTTITLAKENKESTSTVSKLS